MQSFVCWALRIILFLQLWFPVSPVVEAHQEWVHHWWTPWLSPLFPKTLLTISSIQLCWVNTITTRLCCCRGLPGNLLPLSEPHLWPRVTKSTPSLSWLFLQGARKHSKVFCKLPQCDICTWTPKLQGGSTLLSLHILLSASWATSTSSLLCWAVTHQLLMLLAPRLPHPLATGGCCTCGC